MGDSELDLDLDEFSSAEDFLEYYGIDYDPAVVHVNRLHILQRFHDYIDGAGEMPDDDARRREFYAGLLNSAYYDFVRSDARTERVFKVFRVHESTLSIPLGNLTRQIRSGASKV